LSPSLLMFWSPSSPTQEREHDSEDEDEDKYADDVDMPGQNFDSKRRITVRNLRIREDIAKVTAVLPPKIGLFRCVCAVPFLLCRC